MLPYVVLGVFTILVIFLVITVKPTDVRLTAGIRDFFTLSFSAHALEPRSVEADASEPEELEPVLEVIQPEPDDIVE